MKRRFLSVLVAACMVLSLAPASVFAATSVDSLEGLVNAIKGGETEITVTEKITITEDVTLSADAEVTITTGIEDVFTVNSGGSLTLGSNITVNATDSILYANGGTINIKGAVLNLSASEHNLAFASNGGTINLTSGGSLNGTNDKATVSVKGEGSQFNMNGGTVFSANNTAITAKNGATATISGGTVESTGQNADSTYIAAFAGSGGTINVTGGTVKAVGRAVEAESYGIVNISQTEETIPTIYGVVADSGDTGGAANTGGKVTIEGGIIKGGTNGSSAVSVVGVGDLTVTGGTFSDDSAKAYIKEGLTIPAGGGIVHDCAANQETVPGKAPTCKETGLEAATRCKICKPDVEQKVIPADPEAHTYVDGVCTICGAADPNAKGEPVTGCQHDEAQLKWAYDKDNHWNVCECGKAYEKGKHIDENKDGKCDVCGYTLPSDGATATGDDSNMIFFVLLLMISLTLGTITILSRKRKMQQ